MVERMEREVAELQMQMSAAIDRAHRQYRRDLVPLKQAVALFEGRR